MDPATPLSGIDKTQGCDNGVLHNNDLVTDAADDARGREAAQIVPMTCGTINSEHSHIDRRPESSSESVYDDLPEEDFLLLAKNTYSVPNTGAADELPPAKSFVRPKSSEGSQSGFAYGKPLTITGSRIPAQTLPAVGQQRSQPENPLTSQDMDANESTDPAREYAK